MKKFTLIALSTLLSFGTQAAFEIEHSKGGNVVAYSSALPSDMKDGYGAYAAYSGDDNVTLYIHTTEGDQNFCRGEDDDENGSLKINDTLVKVTQYCIDGYTLSLYPTTAAGNAFLLNEFIKKPFVIFGSIKIDATDFTKVKKQIDEGTHGIKEAL